MTTHPLHDATTRVALAAYLHDLGKFAERAGAHAKDPRLDAHLTLYCPFHEEAKGHGWHSHRHAAHTALAFDTIEPWLPPLLGIQSAPYASRRRAADAGTSDATDSLINAAAAHHRPDSFLQWVIATADRVASGFEREEFEKYNHARDETRTGLDHCTARQLTLFEQIRLSSGSTAPDEKALRWRYPLRTLSPASLFPAKAAQCEGRDRDAARQEYHRLWQWFLEAIRLIPEAHRRQLPLWFDHFDSLWLAATQAIPAATAFNVKPEVSLYDHSRTTAALAAALWRWHEAARQTDSAAAQRLRERTDYGESKFLLIQGDFFGIQDFIFASGGDTRKQAAKLLRGRSFQVSLFTEVAALRILDALGLPATSQVINAAGKFLIVAPHTPEVVATLADLRSEFDVWFLQNTFGLAGMGLAWQAASCEDFLLRKDGADDRAAERGFAALRTRLVEQLDCAKHARFDLCRSGARVFSDADYRFGPCAFNGRLPADRVAESGTAASCALSRDQIAIGRALVDRFERLLIVRESYTEMLHSGERLQPLELPLFGYRLAFTAHEEASGRFGELAAKGLLRRCFDFSLPTADDADGSAPLWNGYARRFISGYVPRASGSEHRQSGRYVGVAQEDFPESGDLAPFDLLASEDRQPDESGSGWQGVAALGVLKGDIDNLGELFRIGLQQPTFAKYAALSRQVNAFFAIYLPWLLAREFPKVYTVFAGGDDFFLIGPWRQVQKLALRMRCEFHRYVAENPDLHFSAGIATQKPGAPVHVLAELAEEAMTQAKKFIEPGGNPLQPAKNAVTCFGQTVPWQQWLHLEGAFDRLSALRNDAGLSTAYVYGLLQFVEMRQRESDGDPEAAMWRGRFQYRTRRVVVDRIRDLDEATRQRRFTELATDIGVHGIEMLGASYRIVLFNHLYQFRDR
jgi:CRISPR-associated protein Csm1